MASPARDKYKLELHGFAKEYIRVNRESDPEVATVHIILHFEIRDLARIDGIPSTPMRTRASSRRRVPSRARPRHDETLASRPAARSSRPFISSIHFVIDNRRTRS